MEQGQAVLEDATVEKMGYQGFGSFFVSESVQDMISSSSWTPPIIPQRVQNVRSHYVDMSLQGLGARRMFLVNFNEFTFLNHGAFGACFKRCYQEVHAWQTHCESQPLRFIDRELFAHVVQLLRSMASFVHAEPCDLAFIPNATTGLNTVLKNVTLGPGDEILMMDIGYGSLKTIASAACAQSGATLVQAHILLPIRDSRQMQLELLSQLTKRTRLVILDSITSNTGLVIPVKDLIAECKYRFPGILVLVDAAHALGQLDVDFQGMGADFVVANCHKWLCAPRGTAIMWVKRTHQASMQPLVLSHGHGHGFTSDYIWDGSRDYAPYLAVETALEWWRIAGAEARIYMHKLLAAAVEFLTAEWKSDTVAPLDMSASMACVRLPKQLQHKQSMCKTLSDHGKHLQDSFYACQVEVPVKCLHDVLYVRISVHVYNVMDDYKKLAEVASTIIGNLAKHKRESS